MAPQVMEYDEEIDEFDSYGDEAYVSLNEKVRGEYYEYLGSGVNSNLTKSRRKRVRN